MDAGRELDILIAEKIMGITVVVEPYYNKHHEAVTIPLNKDTGMPLMAYSADIVAAWMLVEHMQRRPEEFSFSYSSYAPSEHEATFSAGDSNCHHAKAYDPTDGHGCTYVEAEGTSAPHAICLAALKALRVEVKVTL